MKKTLFFGLVGIILAFSFVLTSCLDSPGAEGEGANIPQEWRMTYRGSENRYIVIGADFLSFFNMLWPGTILHGNGTLTGMSIGGGGTITQGSGSQIGGKYVYLLRDGQRFGVLYQIEGLGRLIDIGNRNGLEHVNIIESAGGVFNPPVTTSGMPIDFSWGGNTFDN